MVYSFDILNFMRKFKNKQGKPGKPRSEDCEVNQFYSESNKHT